MDFLTRIGLDAGTLEGLFKIAASMVAGALVGWERERGNQPAGLRTHMLVCMGACLVMTVSLWYVGTTGTGDAMRMGAQVISGIGFLGAGTIIKGDYGVRGLTTAASLWVVACIGLALGAGFYWGAIVGAVLTYAALVFVKAIEERAAHDVRRLRLCAQDRENVVSEAVEVLLNTGVNIQEMHTQRAGGQIWIIVSVSGVKETMCMPQLIRQLAEIDGMESVKE